jgi:hypothetical protein
MINKTRTPITISTVIVSGLIIYYNYESITEYFKHIKPNKDFPHISSQENLNINPAEHPQNSPQSSPVSDNSNLTVTQPNFSPTSPLGSNSTAA